MILCIYSFIWGFTSLSTLYRSYHDGWLGGQRKPVHTVGQGSVFVNCRATASNYQLSHLRSGRELNPGHRGGEGECDIMYVICMDISINQESITQ